MVSTAVNSFWTSLPDSENHFENSEWELISINLPCGYLRRRNQPDPGYEDAIFLAYMSASLIDSF